MKFITEVELEIDSDASILPLGTVSVITNKVKIMWELELELRSWGLKSIFYSAQPQAINIEVEKVIGTEGKEETWTDSIDIDIDKFEYECDEESHLLCPQFLRFDNKTKKWTLIF